MATVNTMFETARHNPRYVLYAARQLYDLLEKT